jgi:hypothetical protein
MKQLKPVDSAELSGAIMLLMSLTEVKDVIGNGSIMINSNHIEAINVLFREMLWMRSKLEDCAVKSVSEPQGKHPVVEEKPEAFESWARRQFEKIFALLKEDDKRLNELEKGDPGHE